jgi:lipoate-protein ligase A
MRRLRASLKAIINSGRRSKFVEIDKNKVRTQEDEAEPAPIDQVEERVEAQMKQIEGSAKERVAQGLQDEELELEARKLKDEGKRELEEAGEK